MAEATGSSVSGILCQDAGTIESLFVGTTSIVGSGWFSDPIHVSKIARPLRIWNRVAGAITIVPTSERENARRFESHSSFLLAGSVLPLNDR